MLCILPAIGVLTYTKSLKIQIKALYHPCRESEVLKQALKLWARQTHSAGKG